MKLKNQVNGEQQSQILNNPPKGEKGERMKKIRKVDIYEYPVNLVKNSHVNRKGNLVIDREPFEHMVINKLNEIIERINDQNP